MTKVLGIWDGHDSGAALIEGDQILFAVNEERLTRRKLEVSFPAKSIHACLQYSGTALAEINHISVSTTDFAKTLTRLFPSLKEEYYLIRRRKKRGKGFRPLKKRSKYKLTEYPPSALTKRISRALLEKRLFKLGFRNFRLHMEDHHFSHIAAAAFCSGLTDAIVISLDGVGDGLSGAIYKYYHDTLELIAILPAAHSIGIFFEHVTNLLNMRELEDEGKVMALANYAYPINDHDNPLLDLIRVKNNQFICKYSSTRMYDVLQEIFWHYPSEQFAFMAQRVLEVRIQELIQGIINFQRMKNLCLAGGVFANVKVNRLIRQLPGIENCFVFPHMGDGGLALGAGLATNYKLKGIHKVPLKSALLGPFFSDNEVETIIKEYDGLKYERCDDIADEVAKLISSGEIVFWFQGRAEYGPRALGGRSILAKPDSEDIKNNLNLLLKKRVWYQPFCPSMLEEDAMDILADYDGKPNEFMTMAYMVKKEQQSAVKGVINVDGSCRPQIVRQESIFKHLLNRIKLYTGRGIVLNTSFNLHGEPMVCAPREACATFLDTKCAYMAIHNYLVYK